MTQMSWKIRKSSGKSCIFFLWQPWKTWFSVLKLPLFGQTLHFIGCWHYLINTAMKFISESPINFRMLSVILICLRVMSRFFKAQMSIFRRVYWLEKVTENYTGSLKSTFNFNFPGEKSISIPQCINTPKFNFLKSDYSPLFTRPSVIYEMDF